MSNLSLDRLLDDKWLYEKNWIYYNGESRLVEDVLYALTTLYGNRIGSLSEQECLSLEMDVLIECLLIDLRSVSKDYPKLGIAPLHELYEKDINDLIEIRRSVLEKVPQEHRVHGAAKVVAQSQDRRGVIYSCLRKVG